MPEAGETYSVRFRKGPADEIELKSMVNTMRRVKIVDDIREFESQ